MARFRTQKDVETFCESATFVSDGQTDYGSVEIDTTGTEDRRDRWVEHGWMSPIDKFGSNRYELGAEGKKILARWEQADNPHDELDEETSPQFWENNFSDAWVKATSLKERTYKGIKIKDPNDIPDDVDIPSGHDTYYERDYINNFSYLDVIGSTLSNGNHVEFRGEAGTGKSVAALHLAQFTNTFVERVNFSEEVRMSHLFGHYEVYEGNNGGTEMQWVDGVFTKTARHGGWFIADEIGMASGDVTSILHSALEKGDATLTIPEKGETIDVHDDFRLIGTNNPNYAGTKSRNIAFEDRVEIFKFDYFDLDTEVNIVMNEVDDVEKSDVTPIVEVGRELREKYNEGTLNKTITPRSMIRAAEYLDKMDPETACLATYPDRYPEEQGHARTVTKVIETSNSF